MKPVVKTVDFKGLILISLTAASSYIDSKMSIGLLFRFLKHVSKTVKSSTNFHPSGKSTPRLFILVRNKIGPRCFPWVYHYKLEGIKVNIQVFDDLRSIRKEGRNYSY